MEKKPRVLFLLFEGLAETVIESQVLSNVRLLQERGVADFEVWAFACLRPVMTKSLARCDGASQLAQAPVRVHRGIRPLSPLAYLINVLLFAWRLFPVRRSFTHIHARTDYSAAVAAPLARLLGLKLIWDCRGDAAAEVEERFAGSTGWLALLVRLRVRELLAYTWLASRYCSGAVFVTEELRKLYRGLVGTKHTEVVPCAAHEEFFFFDADLRAARRSELKVDSEATLYVYSGGLTEYQCFADTVALFSATLKASPNSRLLVLTPVVELANSHLANIPKGVCIVRSCGLLEVNAYLNAADVGFLLRQNLRTNFVASPTKFAEYALAGLPVIVTDAVPYAYQASLEAGSLVRVVDGLPVLQPVDRAAIAQHFRERIGRSRFIACYQRLFAIE